MEKEGNMKKEEVVIGSRQFSIEIIDRDIPLEPAISKWTQNIKIYM